MAGAGTAKATDHCSPRATLVIPFNRCETVLRTAVAEHRWAAPHHAFFIPPGERIAASCGITRLATATAAYARRFGELPSETRRRGR